MAGNEQTRITEELTSLGTGTGIELERPEAPEPAAISEPFDPEKIEVITRSMTIDLLLSRIRSAAIDLEPDFQRRRGIWNEVRQSRLIESILLKIPLPTFYVAEDIEENWAVVDGIQRLTTITRFVDPEAIGETRLVLQGLEYLEDAYAGKHFEELPPRLQRRLKETELVVHVIRHGTPEPVKFNIFARINTGGMPLSAQELRHALTPGPARKILEDWSLGKEFKQATASGVRDERMADRELVLRFVAFRLTRYDLYQGGDFDQFLSEAMRRLNSIAAEVELEGAEAKATIPNVPEEMELPLTPVADAVDVTEYEQACTDERKPESEPLSLASLEAEFKSAMETAFAIFGDDAFRKRYREDDPRHPINKALFETVAVNLAALDQDQRNLLVERKDDVRNSLMELMNISKFDTAVSQGTGNPAKVRTRFGELEKIFKKVLS